MLPENVTIDRLPVAAEDAGDGAVLVSTTTPTAALLTLTSWARDHGGELAQLSVTRPSLDDVYVALTSQHDGATT